MTVSSARPAGAQDAGGLAQKYADTPSRHDFLATKLAFNQRTLAGDYQRVGSRNAKWDAAAEAFLEGMARYFTNSGVEVQYQLPDVPTRDELIDQSRKLVEELGCNDPLVLYCRATLLMDRGGDLDSLRPAYEMAVQAYEKLRESGYNPFRKAMAARRMLLIAGMPSSPWVTHPSAQTAESDAFDFEVACFTEAGFTPEEARVLIDYVVKPKIDSDVPSEQLKRFAEAIAGADEHKWAALIVEGNAHQTAASEARGGGYANTVTPEGWAGFRAGMTAAGALYERAHAMHPDRPEAAAHMVTVAMAGHAANGDARHWFEQAINAQVDYDPAWVNYRQSLLPRWGGSHEEMLELGRLALATGRFDTDVPHRYYYQLWSIAWDSDGDWGAVRRFGPSIWNGLEQLYAGIIPPLVERDRWNANAYAAERLAAAWALHAWDNAAALLAPGGEGQGVDSTPFRAWAFARVGATPDAALAEIAARTGPQKTAVARADSLSERGNADAAVAALRKALDSLPADDPGRPFLEMRLREQEFLALLSEAPAGEWIDLPTDLAWWGVVEGDWRSEEGKLIATVEPDNRTADERWGEAAGQPLLVFLPRMPEAYEVQASFPIPKNADGQPCITARVGLWPGWGAYEGGSVRLGQYMNMMQFNPGGAGRRQEVAMNSTQAVPVLRIRVSPDGSTATWLNERIRSERLSRMTPRYGITPRHIAITTMGLHVGDELVVERLQVRRPGR